LLCLLDGLYPFILVVSIYFEGVFDMSTLQEAIGAVIDLGSNSAKITIAQLVDDNIKIIAKESTMLRLGESVNATGEISPEKQDTVITTLQKYQQLAQEHNAFSLTVVATEAVRQARNHQAFLNAIREQTGLTVHLLSGEIEAALTYLGATSDNLATPNAGVVDIGGGSTELIMAQKGHIQWLTSLPIGSGWLHDHYLASNPPAVAETEQAHAFLKTYLRRLHLPQMPVMLVATGSSAQILLALAKQALKVAEERPILRCNDLLGCLGLLSALPAEDIAMRYELQLERARVLPGGALILLALLELLHLEEIAISQRGLSEGVLLAALRYGESWRDYPDIKIDTSRVCKAPPLSDTDEGEKPATKSVQQSETFAERGRHELRQCGKKFVKWIGPVLKNEDVEAVHKMRVASRRLRATLDAYQLACSPKPFKRVYRVVKQAADLLGTARDTDVMLQHREQQQKQMSDEEIPGLQWLAHRLLTYREQQQREIEAFFEDFQRPLFMRLIEACIPEGVSKHGKS
jgi:exopolyphosphatase/pppGpp-phosphohydrolase